MKKIRIVYCWSSSAEAIALGFERAGCFAVVVDGTPEKGFPSMREAFAHYSTLTGYDK